MISRLLEFSRRIIGSVSKVDTGGGYNQDLLHFSSPGDDSFPLPRDLVAMVPSPRTGGKVAVAYLDEMNIQLAKAGDKRIYSRKESGEPTAHVWLKADGTISVSNGVGSIELGTNGTINLNGVEIAPDGSVSVPVSLKIQDKEVNLHTHPGVTTGPGVSGPF